jgi:hypothetical protein
MRGRTLINATLWLKVPSAKETLTLVSAVAWVQPALLKWRGRFWI